MGAQQPQNVSSLHSKMLSTQQCLYDAKAHEALLKANPSAETFWSQNGSDEHWAGVVKLHKTALKNPNNS